MWSDLRYRLRSFWSRTRAEQELDEELRYHLERETEKWVQRGVPRAEAARQARLAFGGPEQVKEQVRDQRGVQWLEEFLRDLRQGIRVMRLSPSFSAVVVLTLALGIGANTAVFSIIDALMLRWLPVHDPQQLQQLKLQGSMDSLSYPIVRLLEEQREMFSGVAGFSGWTFVVGSADSLHRVPGAMVTGGYYGTLGVQPIIGRLLEPEDDRPGAPAVVVLSDGYWRRECNADVSVVGRTMRVSGVPVTVVGVSTPGFTGANVGAVADLTMTVSSLPLVNPEAAPLVTAGNFWLRVLVRLPPGLKPPQVQGRLTDMWPRISEGVIPPNWPPDRKKDLASAVFALRPGATGWTYLREQFRQPLLVVMAIVSLVLLIACANVANLLLARAAVRRKEIAVRMAIGAGRGRIVRQLLTENLVLALAGAGLGLALAWISSSLLIRLISSTRNSVVFDLTPNAHVLGFTLGLSFATTMLFGLAPALQATATRPSTALKEQTSSRSRARLLSSLVTLQVALSLLLLIGAGLFVRTFENLRTLDPGFRAEGVLLAELEGRRSSVSPEVLSGLQQVPGVVAASVSTHTPLSGAIWSEPAVPTGLPLPQRDNALFIGAGPQFFETMQIPLRAGRGFTEGDTIGRPDVAIVDDEFAHKYYPDQNPLGQRLSTRVRGKRVELEIVGVAKSVQLKALRTVASPTVYVPYLQLTGNFPSTIEVSFKGSAAVVAAAIQKELQTRYSDAPIEVRGLSDQVAAALIQERLVARLASGFGGLALALACVGLYGLLHYRVVCRTRDIGICLALGADRGRIVLRELREVFIWIGLGIGLGLPAALAASRWIRSLLFGVGPADPVTLVLATLVLVMAAVGAALGPLRSASRINPMTALRQE